MVTKVTGHIANPKPAPTGLEVLGKLVWGLVKEGHLKGWAGNYNTDSSTPVRGASTKSDGRPHNS